MIFNKEAENIWVHWEQISVHRVLSTSTHIVYHKQSSICGPNVANTQHIAMWRKIQFWWVTPYFLTNPHDGVVHTKKAMEKECMCSWQLAMKHWRHIVPNVCQVMWTLKRLILNMSRSCAMAEWCLSGSTCEFPHGIQQGLDQCEIHLWQTPSPKRFVLCQSIQHPMVVVSSTVLDILSSCLREACSMY